MNIQFSMEGFSINIGTLYMRKYMWNQSSAAESGMNIWRLLKL